jgi:hypothetical protein
MLRRPTRQSSLAEAWYAHSLLNDGHSVAEAIAFAEACQDEGDRLAELRSAPVGVVSPTVERVGWRRLLFGP